MNKDDLKYFNTGAMIYAIIILIALMALILCGCLHRGDKIKYEQGIVIRKTMTPGYYHTYTIYDRVYYGRSYNGRRQYVNVPRLHRTYIQPIYTVTFKCEHEKVFDINRDDIYNSLNRLDTVTIEYYELLNHSKEVKDYDFLTAYKQKRW